MFTAIQIAIREYYRKEREGIVKQYRSKNYIRQFSADLRRSQAAAGGPALQRRSLDGRRQHR